MTEVFVPLLYCLAGVCLFAAIQHLLIAARRSWDRTQLSIAALTFSILLFILADAAGYQSTNAETFVELRRWQVTFAMTVYCALQWFVACFAGFRPRYLLAAMRAFFASGIVMNFILPHGLGLAEVPGRNQ